MDFPTKVVVGVALQNTTDRAKRLVGIFRVGGFN